MRSLFLLAILIQMSLCTPALTQELAVASTIPIQLEGPRVGITFLSPEFVDKQKLDHDVELSSAVAQIGWQFENRFFTMTDGGTAVAEFVALVGGFEQGLFIPSVSWLLGFRTGSGFEFGVGPNLSLTGSSAVIAAGVTIQSEEINFPINLAVATSDDGLRYSLLFGFNLRSPVR